MRTLPLMAAPTVNECRFPVDVVYTWVDGDDPEWDAAREARISGMEGTAQTREASGRARFISRDELRYSLRSVHLFAPVGPQHLRRDERPGARRGSRSTIPA